MHFEYHGILIPRIFIPTAFRGGGVVGGSEQFFCFGPRKFKNLHPPPLEHQGGGGGHPPKKVKITLFSQGGGGGRAPGPPGSATGSYR